VKRHDHPCTETNRDDTSELESRVAKQRRPAAGAIHVLLDVAPEARQRHRHAQKGDQMPNRRLFANHQNTHQESNDMRQAIQQKIRPSQVASTDGVRGVDGHDRQVARPHLSAKDGACCQPCGDQNARVPGGVRGCHRT
jgi:hypothetical protein